MALVIASVLVFSSVGIVSLQEDVHAQQQQQQQQQQEDTSKTTIKIGALLTDSTTHQERLKSMELARDDFNRNNDDYILELIYYQINPNGEGSDWHSDNRTGTQINHAFTQDNITYFVGPMGSTDTRSAKAQLEEILIPANPNADFAVISPASTDPRLRIDDNVFRMVIDDSQQAVVLADHLYSQGKTHVVMIGLNNSQHEHERDSWSEGIEKEFRKNFDNNISEHFTLIRNDNQDATYDTLAQNLNRIVSNLASQHGADNVAVVAMIYAPDLSNIVQAINRDSSLTDLGMVKWYGPDGVAFRSEVATEGDPNVGVFLASVGFTASQYSTDSNSVKDDVRNRLLSEGVRPTTIESIYLYSSYDATIILANAIAERDRLNNAKTVKQLLHEIAAKPNEGALGDYGFNAEGDLDEPFDFRLGTIVLDSDQKPQWIERKTITIGALVQYTQENNDAANLKAMELSVKDINNDHRANSEYVVELVPIDITRYVSSGDTQGLVQRISGAIQNDGITYFVGPTTSAETGPIKILSDQINNTVFISPGSSSPILPLPDGGVLDLTQADGIFRLVPNETHQATELTELILEADNQKTIILVRDQWEGIVSHLITGGFDQNVDYPLVTFETAESFAGDKSAALAHHRIIAGNTNDRLEQILSSYDSKYVSLLFIGYPLDFEYHVQAILSSEDSLDNLYAIDWYGASTFIGEPASLRDSNVAKFAEDVSLTGTRYTVEPNNVNQNLCNRLSSQGVTCDRYASEMFASYDAVHLLVDSIIAQDERASDNDDSNDRTARELVLSVAAGDEEHHLQHVDRPIGDGALGVYALSAGGDLNEPATYTPLQATAKGGWVPVVEQLLRICR